MIPKRPNGYGDPYWGDGSGESVVGSLGIDPASDRTVLARSRSGKVLTSVDGEGCIFDFSHDANQSLMFIVNQNNSQIDVVERRSGRLLSSFGQVGQLPGQFDQAHGIATDSKSNVFVAENRGRRIRKFRVVQ